jgi:NAD(P)-dependent dehydrogenase (short-subunit alcohol dehydrogenase family)
VASFDEVHALARAVADEHGVPDVLVNNAGVGMSGSLADMTIEDWRWIRSINLDGVVHGCLAFGPAMLGRGRGHVVNTSSVLGYTVTAGEPAYGATKAAVLSLSRSLHADWRPRGVGVTAVCPGLIDTGIIDTTRFAGPEPERRRRHAQQAFRRGHKPEKVAAAIVDAIRRDRAVVTVGWEAKLAWGLHRAMPVPWAQRLAGTRRR